MIADGSTRLAEMKDNIISSESQLLKLEQKATVKASELKSKLSELESKRELLAIFKAIMSIGSAILETFSFDKFLPKKEKVRKEIETTKTEIISNKQLLKEINENQQKLDSKLTPLLNQLDKEIRGSNLNDQSRSQIELDISRYKLTNLFKEFKHYLKQISIESI